MRRDDLVKVFAGSFVFIFSILGFFHSQWWLLITMFVGLNLFQYGFSGFCPLEKILKSLRIGG